MTDNKTLFIDGMEVEFSDEPNLLEVIRKAGQRYDAHHLIESSFGGSNAWWNLHPAAFPSEHQAGIHAANSLANLIF